MSASGDLARSVADIHAAATRAACRSAKPAPVKCETCLDLEVISWIVGGTPFVTSCPDCVLHDPEWAS